MAHCLKMREGSVYEDTVANIIPKIQIEYFLHNGILKEVILTQFC